MLRKTFAILTILIAILNCTPEEPTPQNTFVVEAFLFAEEPVDNIIIKHTVPLEKTSLIIDPIDDALVVLIKNGQEFPLEATGDGGSYAYLLQDLQVNVGDLFRIEINYNGITAFGETTVPEATKGLEISETIIELPPIGPEFIDAINKINLFSSWDNPNNELHYMIIEDREKVKDPIFPDQIADQLQQFRFVSAPTRESLFDINAANFTTFGIYVVKVYRINQEYADLYESLVQDSRDLNEPLSNITNALGIFSAFASDSVFFEIRRQ